MQQLIIILAFVQLINAFSCTITNNGVGVCGAGCSTCNQGICQSCCPNYKMQLNQCIQCLDPQCLTCSTGSPEQCLTCDSGYSASLTNSSQCNLCNSIYELNCNAYNNCTGNSNCLNCQLYAMNGNTTCLICASIYRYCQTCNNSQCLTCISGYALNITNYLQCVLCILPKCTQCTAGPLCSTCISGYYSLNGTCQPCRLPCISCQSLDYCMYCDYSLNRYILVNHTCLTCNASLLGCLSCVTVPLSGLIVCQSCLDGYYFFNATCTVCLSPCLTCTSLQCISCVAGYLFNATTSHCDTCSDILTNCRICNSTSLCHTCTIDSYMNSTTNSCFTCDSIFPGCLSCDLVRCSTCLPGYLYTTNATCSSILCLSPCLACKSTAVLCVSCIAGYYLVNTTCLLCGSTCMTCLNLTYCSSCIENYEWNNGSCTACPSGKTYNPFSMLCQTCSSSCLACEWWTGCTSCSSLFQLSVSDGFSKCTDICGDTFAIDFPCDSPLGVANDGCTDECSVEDNYSCAKTLGTFSINGASTSLNTSECSYLGTTSISVVSAEQSLFANNLRIGFRIKPYLFGMPTSSDSQTYLKSVFQLSPLDTVASYSIEVDEKAETVTFSIDHSTDISSLSLSLAINYNYLSTQSPMFQYMNNLTYSLPLSQILSSGRLGQYEEESSLSLCKLLYGWSTGLAICALLVMVIGMFGKELAGLDQVVLCQTTFLLIIFYQGKLTLPLLSLSGLRYSTGLHFSDSTIALNQGQSYILQMDTSSFLYSCNLNIAAYALPLASSFLILLYKLRFKHLPAKRDLAQQFYEVIMGETVLYLVVFNLSAVAAYSSLFYAHSSKSNYYDNLAILTAVLFTVFAIFNYFAKPEIVGMFRSAFRLQSDERESRKSNFMEKYTQCISKRCWEERLSGLYATITINFYILYLAYLALLLTLTILAPFPYLPCLGALQAVMLILVVVVRPHFNPVEKLRALLTWSITLLGTITVYTQPQTYGLPILFLLLLTVHMILSLISIVSSLWQLIKRKCNDRTQVVKELMKDGQIEGEKSALRELILRYQQLDSKACSLDQEVEKIQMNYKENLERVDNRSGSLKKEEVDEERVQFENEIINEEHEHFRYQKGLEFFNKYDGTIDEDLVKGEFGRID